MTWIRIEPNELQSVATVLRNLAVESADVGTSLTSCAQCPMPAQLEAQAQAVIAQVDRILDGAAAAFAAEANDLEVRAGIAATDVATAGSVGSTTVTPSMAIIGGGGYGFTISNAAGDPYGMGSSVGGYTPSMAIIGGGDPYATSTSVGGYTPSMAIVGGTGAYSPSPSVGGYSSGVAIIGGGTADDNPAMILAKTAQQFRERAETRIQALAASGDPTLGRIAMNATTALGRAAGYVVSPSQADVERALGRPVSLAEFQGMNTGGVDSTPLLNVPTNIFEGI